MTKLRHSQNSWSAAIHLLRSWQLSGNKLDPTQKLVAALKPLIESFSQPEDIALDPFCGSGSTFLAAKILNRRRYLGIELYPHHHAAAKQRPQPNGIRASERVYPLQTEQASTLMPPIGGTLQFSRSFSAQSAALTPALQRSLCYSSL
jgi:hypothetical protein